MARKRNPNRDKAFEMFKENGGNITNREIGKRLGVLEKTISAWKSRDEWNDKLGIETKRSTSNNRSTTKNEPTADIRSKKRNEIIESLVEAGTYSPALNFLIEIYLDAYEEYLENKNEKLRKELAKLLGQLGLDGKNKELIKKSGVLLSKPAEEEKEKEKPANSKLLQFRQRMQR